MPRPTRPPPFAYLLVLMTLGAAHAPRTRKRAA